MQEFIPRYVEATRDDNLRAWPKLDVVSDDFVHAHLMIFCQHPRFGFLGRNLPPAALAAREPDAASLLAEVHQAILEALLRRGTANKFQEWHHDLILLLSTIAPLQKNPSLSPLLSRILGHKHPGVVLPDRALCLPTFCHSI